MNKQNQVPFLSGTVTQTSCHSRMNGVFHGGNDYSAAIVNSVYADAIGTVLWSGLDSAKRLDVHALYEYKGGPTKEPI